MNKIKLLRGEGNEQAMREKIDELVKAVNSGFKLSEAVKAAPSGPDAPEGATVVAVVPGVEPIKP